MFRADALWPPFDSYYQKIIKPAAAETGLATLRSDEIHGTNVIIDDIWQSLWTARVVIADVSGGNPNVNYELGLSDALGVPTIIISGKVEDLPFDYSHKRCIIYDRQEAGCDEKLRINLIRTINAVLAETSDRDHLKWPYDTRSLREAAGGLLLASEESRSIVIRGANLVRKVIGTAYGPHGSSFALPQSVISSGQVNRGAQIAHGVKSLNPLEANGIEQIRSAASAVYETSGDGSKLVCILAAGFMSRGQELIEKGFHPKEVIERLEYWVRHVRECLALSARELTGTDLIAVATTAAGGDKRIGELVFQAMKRAGRNGVVTIETTDQAETTLEVSEGIVVDQGYLSDFFVTDTAALECVLENCSILLYEKHITSMKDLLPVLEQAAKTNTSLLVVAGDVEGEALATLTVNKIKGTLRCAAIKAPGVGERRKALLGDIAVLTGGKFLHEELGVPLANTRLEDLGRAEKVVVSKSETTIIGGGGTNEAIDERIRLVRAELDGTFSAFERERLQERLARLAKSLAVLRAGGLSEADRSRERYFLESAMHSARSAIEDGSVAGGGTALLRCGRGLVRKATASELDMEALGAIASVLEEPFIQLVENAHQSSTEMLVETMDSDSPYWGFNANEGKVCDLAEAGVLDALKPIELALRTALAHAKTVLQTGTWDLSESPPQQAIGPLRET